MNVFAGIFAGFYGIMRLAEGFVSQVALFNCKFAKSQIEVANSGHVVF